jgi:cob(I)alamin adenosyltransferase
MDMFFNAIKRDAGNGRIERKVFETASYGKQLGLILDVLLPLTGSKVVSSKEAEKARKNLENIYNDIYEIRQTVSREEIKEATDTLLNLKRSEPDRFKKELDRLSG